MSLHINLYLAGTAKLCIGKIAVHAAVISIVIDRNDETPTLVSFSVFRHWNILWSGMDLPCNYIPLICFMHLLKIQNLEVLEQSFWTILFNQAFLFQTYHIT